VGRAAKRRRSGGAGPGARPIRRGLTVVLTRPAERSAKLAARLEALGFDVVVVPLIELEPIETGSIDLAPYDWLVLTSITGAKELRRRANGEPRRVAAIGKATAEAWDGKVDLVPADSTQEGLLAELPRPAGRVLFAGAEEARRLLVDELDADFIALYRTKELHPEDFPEAHLVVLASASAARAYGKLALAAPAISIGPETTAAAEAAGVNVAREAATHDLDGLVGAVEEAVR
jgi:uroporphyrinogen III methyltransferase / synthase